MAKHKSVRKTLKTVKELNAKLIEGINVLTDNFDPVTGGPLFDAAETLHWLTRTGGVRDIKQANRRQIRAWIRAAAQDDDDEQDEDVE